MYVSEKNIINSPLFQKECNVKFYHYIPVDLNERLYVVTISKGVPAHPHPLLVKTPQNSLSEIEKIIRNKNVID